MYEFYISIYLILCSLRHCVIKLLLLLMFCDDVPGQPRRHLLQSGWSVFVSSKRLVAGDAFIFLRFVDFYVNDILQLYLFIFLM